MFILTTPAESESAFPDASERNAWNDGRSFVFLHTCQAKVWKWFDFHHSLTGAATKLDKLRHYHQTKYFMSNRAKGKNNRKHGPDQRSFGTGIFFFFFPYSTLKMEQQ